MFDHNPAAAENLETQEMQLRTALTALGDGRTVRADQRALHRELVHLLIVSGKVGEAVRLAHRWEAETMREAEHGDIVTDALAELETARPEAASKARAAIAPTLRAAA